MIFPWKRVLLTRLSAGSVVPLLPEVGGVVYKATACVSNHSGTHPGMRVIHFFWLGFFEHFSSCHSLAGL